MPGERLKGIFYARRVRWYLRYGGSPRGHIDPILIAAWCLTGAKQQDCDRIVVELDGMLPIMYTVAQVEEAIRKEPGKFRGWILPPPVNQADAIRRRWMEKRFLPSSTTG